MGWWANSQSDFVIVVEFSIWAKFGQGSGKVQATLGKFGQVLAKFGQSSGKVRAKLGQGSGKVRASSGKFGQSSGKVRAIALKSGLISTN